MFFFFPISTDAPVYHWPFATVGIIVANVVIFFAMMAGLVDPLNGWVLTHGETLRPNEWLLSVFTHADIFHLLGNMLFLWVFGLVVEGKLGWMRFLACYLFIGVTESAVEQLLMLGYDGSEPSFSLGASTAIYGVLAMAAVWAPKNEVGVFYFVWCLFVYTGTFDVAISMVAAFYIGLDLLWAVLGGGAIGTSMLHVAGAAIGLPLAVVMLKRGMVDCEGWDMFHVWANDLGGHRERAEQQEKKALERTERRKQQAERLEIEGSAQVREFLNAGNADAAKTLVEKLNSSGINIELGETDLTKIINALHKKKQWAESAPLMAQLIRVAPERADRVRLLLAQICVAELERPGRALDLLGETSVETLPPKQQQLAGKIAARAEQMQATGLVELDDDQW